MATLPVLMSDRAFDEIYDMIARSCPNACVLWLNRLNNPELSDRYASHCAKLGLNS